MCRIPIAIIARAARIVRMYRAGETGKSGDRSPSGIRDSSPEKDLGRFGVLKIGPFDQFCDVFSHFAVFDTVFGSFWMLGALFLEVPKA